MLNSLIAVTSTSGRTTLTSRIAAFASASLRASLRWYRRRSTIHSLNALDDRALEDIGLRRSEIEALDYALPGEHRDRYLHYRMNSGR